MLNSNEFYMTSLCMRGWFSLHSRDGFRRGAVFPSFPDLVGQLSHGQDSLAMCQSCRVAGTPFDSTVQGCLNGDGVA